MYSDYILKIEVANNDIRARMTGQPPIPRPTYREFVEQNFPEYVDVIRGQGLVDTMGDIGQLDPFVTNTINRLRTQGKQDSEIIKLIKSSKKYRNIDASAYGLKMEAGK